MKLRIASLTILLLGLAATASAQQQLYDNGPINGTVHAWNLDTVSNKYGCCKSGTDSPDGGGTMTGFEFGAWEFAGDQLTSIDWSVTSEENGGTVYGSGTARGANIIDTFLSTNEFGFDIDHITVSGLNVSLTSGQTYWLNLQNAMVSSGDPVYWDENSGVGCGGTGGGQNCPSQASQSALGTIPSEAFTIDGSSSSGTTPEPGSILLFGSGLLGVAWALRRKLRA